jgi:NADH dehydrogenase
MIQWAWSYLTYERGARLITGSDDLPGWAESERGSGAAALAPRNMKDEIPEPVIPVGKGRS